MSVGDFGVVAAWFLGAFASGYVSGVLMRAVRRVIESVTGVGG